MTNYFSSDWHLNHANILKYDNRPFKDIKEHDEVIINNYKSIVSNYDNFYFLGDFAFASNGYIEKILNSLNGNKFFIRGNHDKKDTIRLYKKYGTYLGELETVEINKQKIVLCHYSMRVWNGSHKGFWHLYGHSHGSLEHLLNGKSFDVGINVHNYFTYIF